MEVNSPYDMGWSQGGAPDTQVHYLQELWNKHSDAWHKLHISNLVFYVKQNIRTVVREW